MSNSILRSSRLALRAAVAASSVLTCLLATRVSARGDDLMVARSPGMRTNTIRMVGNFLAPGGYFLSSASGRSALGASKFFNEVNFLTRPKQLGSLRISGGGQWVSTSDHFLPFLSDRNYLWMGGPVVKITSSTSPTQPNLFFTGGAYLARLRSQNLGFDTTQLTFGATAGVEVPVGRYVQVRLGYRAQSEVRGIDLSGFQATITVR